MRLLEAGVDDFRNLAATRLVFSPGVNVFLGANGQGKSNLLEALDYVSLGRSHRGARDDDLLRFGAAGARISLALEEDSGTRRVFTCALGRGGERRLQFDGVAIERRADLVGQVATVLFDPATVSLATDGPEPRRRFADQAISSLDRSYLEHLQAYHRALRQKASLLRDLRRDGARVAAIAREELGAWNRELARHAAPLCATRAIWARRLGPLVATAYAELDPASAPLVFRYRPRLATCRGDDGEKSDLAREILAEIDYIGEDEIRRGRPLAGPHLDDFELLLGGVSLRGFGSRGEMRSAALALKLAHGELIFQQRHVRPILFFDDVFSELDKGRARRLQERCAADHQLMIATARADDVAGWRPVDLRTWEINAGRVEAGGA